MQLNDFPQSNEGQIDVQTNNRTVCLAIENKFFFWFYNLILLLFLYNTRISFDDL